MLTRTRQGWSPPAWLERRLMLAEARAHAMAGDIQAALEAADRCGGDSTLDVTVVRAQARVAAGDLKALEQRMHSAVDSAVDEPGTVLDPALLEALLLDARIRYASGDRMAGRHSLARALQLGRSEDVRLPFVMERAWILPVLRTDTELAQSYQALFQPDPGGHGHDALRSLITRPGEPAVVEPLTEREQEVLKHVAQLLSTAEIANELYISVNTVKTHLKSVHRKLAVAHRREAVRRAKELKLL
jgi:LuxR family maltose regulon positive regulatory protein